jgi:hypothetical protein
MSRYVAGTRYCYKGQECNRFGVPLEPLPNHQNNPKENKVPLVDPTVRNILKFIAHRDGVLLRILRNSFGMPEVDEILSELEKLELVIRSNRNEYRATDRGIQHLSATESSTEIPHDLTTAELQVLYYVEYAERVLDRPGENWERLFCRIGTEVFEALKSLLKRCLIFEDRDITCPTYRTSSEGRRALRIARYGL